MATLTVYAGAGDGHINNNSSSWSTAHDNTSGNATDYTTNPSESGVDYTDQWFIKRAFLPFDTSALPDDCTINSAKIYVYVTEIQDQDNDEYAYLAAVHTFQASSSSITNADYDDCGSDNDTAGRAYLTPIQKGSSNLDISDVTLNAYNFLTLNATGLGWISKTGISYFGVREGHDLENVATNGGTNTGSKIKFSQSETSGTSQDPYIEIVYTDNTTTSTTTSTTTTSSSTSTTTTQTSTSTSTSTTTTSTSSSTSTTRSTSTSTTQTTTSTTTTSSSTSTTTTSTTLDYSISINLA